MNIIKKFQLPLIALAIFIVALVVVNADMVFAGQISNQMPTQAAKFKTYEFFASSTDVATVATTTSATSTNITPFFNADNEYDQGYFVIAGAKKVTVYFGRGGATGANTGNTLYKVQVTPNGTDWYDFGKLMQSTSTAYQIHDTITAATSTKVFGFDNSKDSFFAMRCIALETTDGEHRCRASAEF